MRIKTFLAISSFALFASACGSKDSSSGDNYQSCSLPSTSQSIDLATCLESKNSSDLKASCESGDPAGTYAQTQCNIATGSKGCVYKNQNSVELTLWYSGAAWTADGATANCASAYQGSIITK